MEKELNLVRIKFRTLTVVLLLIMTLAMSCVFYLKRDASFDLFSEASLVSMINVAKYDIDNGGIKYGIRFMFMKGTEDVFTNFVGSAYRIYYSDDAGLYGSMAAYNSQIGLHGWVFYFFTKYIIRNSLSVLRIGCCLLLALVLSLICYQLYKKYGLLLSSSFYLASILSPWLRNFSTNLCNVAFTWFIPMLLGIICLNNLNKRFWLYPLFFLTMLVRTACGYDYIPVIMLTSIMFLVPEWIYSIKRNKKQSKLLFKAIFGVGISSLLGFASAFIIHSYMRGDGNILAGIDDIYRNTALRRTVGVIGNSESPEAVYASSFDVLRMYLRNYKYGVSNNTTGRYALSLLMLFPICILFRKIMKRQHLLNRDTYLFIFSFITCISWFILGKQHSYVHTHLNYVMWYMGFIQIGTYLILKYILKICYYYNKEKVSTLGEKIVHKLLEEIVKD